MLVFFEVLIWGTFQVFPATSFEIESRETCRISTSDFPLGEPSFVGDGLAEDNI